jgi:N6-L-threonylcarbamoyladenine synthase
MRRQRVQKEAESLFFNYTPGLQKRETDAYDECTAMRILAIETSCDETALALLDASGTLSHPQFAPQKNIVASQISIHKEWGGVVPNLAKREHIRVLPLIYKKLLAEKTPDIIAVTVGPGLEPALWAGIEFAKSIYKDLKKKNKKLKIIGVNHLEGHLWSFLLDTKKNDAKKIFPAVGLIVSGGHTTLLKMDSLTKWKTLGETKDDAVGEAFDKVARMIGLPYPGGPEIQRIAEKGNPDAIAFPRPMIHSKDYNFSYSGLKTSVLYYMRDHTRAKKEDVAASFQSAALAPLIHKTMRAAKEYGAKSIILSGGVAANRALREKLKTESKKMKLSFFAPPMNFNTDNAMMIAAAGYISYMRKKSRALKANGNLKI